ncbi:MAG: lactate racemase domain-containing protein, partial [Planctomycetota bacterium]
MIDFLESTDRPLADDEVLARVEQWVSDVEGSDRVLLLGPDATRASSFAGKICERIYQCLYGRGCQVNLMPTVGTHQPTLTDLHSILSMYGRIPLHEFRWHHHHQESELIRIGQIEGDVLNKLSNGVIDQSVDIHVNRRLIAGGYDRIYSVGQVVPHEVLGMANFDKNVFIGCGGHPYISMSHWVAALAGIENVLGNPTATPRQLLDLASQAYMANQEATPIDYILTVRAPHEETLQNFGVYFGRDKETYFRAADLSGKLNIFKLIKRSHSFVVHLPEKKYRSLWLAAKSIYRTRRAVAAGGEIHILASGLDRIGESDLQSRLICQGYAGTRAIQDLVTRDHARSGLGGQLGIAAHL